MGKAGSSTIQDFLANAEVNTSFHPIKSMGTKGNGWKLAAGSGTRKAQYYWVENLGKLTNQQLLEVSQSSWNKLREEVEATGTKNFVISSEHISAQLSEDDYAIRKLKSRLCEVFADIRIIIYVRDQIDWLKSFYCQTVKGPTRSEKRFENFISEMDDYKNFWDYYSLFSAWANAFGTDRVSVTLFDTRCLINGDLISDFCYKICADYAPPHKGKKRILNKSPTFKQIQILRKLNELNNTPIKRYSSEFARRVTLRSSPLFFDNFTDHYDRIILKKISPSNRKMNESFLKSSSILLPIL